MYFRPLASASRRARVADEGILQIGTVGDFLTPPPNQARSNTHAVHLAPATGVTAGGVGASLPAQLAVDFLAWIECVHNRYHFKKHRRG